MRETRDRRGKASETQSGKRCEKKRDLDRDRQKPPEKQTQQAKPREKS